MIINKKSFLLQIQISHHELQNHAILEKCRENIGLKSVKKMDFQKFHRQNSIIKTWKTRKMRFFPRFSETHSVKKYKAQQMILPMRDQVKTDIYEKLRSKSVSLTKFLWKSMTWCCWSQVKYWSSFPKLLSKGHGHQQKVLILSNTNDPQQI